MNLVEMLEPTEGEPCQWVGVYVTKWQREWGKPSVMFRDVNTAAIASVSEVKALVDAVRAYLRLEDDPPFSNIGVAEWNAASAVARNELDSALAALHPPSEKDETE